MRFSWNPSKVDGSITKGFPFFLIGFLRLSKESVSQLTCWKNSILPHGYAWPISSQKMVKWKLPSLIISTSLNATQAIPWLCWALEGFLRHRGTRTRRWLTLNNAPRPGRRARQPTQPWPTYTSVRVALRPRKMRSNWQTRLKWMMNGKTPFFHL